jgi:hypothetical protein
MAEQVPPQLMEEINRAYAAITSIHNIVVKAQEDIEEEESWDTCVEIADKAMSEAGPIALSWVLKNPYKTVRRMAPRMISENIRKKINEDTTLFGDKIRDLLDNVSNAQNKAQLYSAFTKLIDAVKQMKDTWKIIHEYAKPVPQEEPRKERLRGGRTRRTHRKRNRNHRKRTQRKR